MKSLRGLATVGADVVEAVAVLFRVTVVVCGFLLFVCKLFVVLCGLVVCGPTLVVLLPATVCFEVPLCFVVPLLGIFVADFSVLPLIVDFVTFVVFLWCVVVILGALVVGFAHTETTTTHKISAKVKSDVLLIVQRKIETILLPKAAFIVGQRSLCSITPKKRAAI